MNDRFTPPPGIGSGRRRNLFAQVVEELGIRIVRGDLAPDRAVSEGGRSRARVRRQPFRDPRGGQDAGRQGPAGIKDADRHPRSVAHALEPSRRRGVALALRLHAAGAVLRRAVRDTADDRAGGGRPCRGACRPGDLVDIETAFQAMVEASQANTSGSRGRPALPSWHPGRGTAIRCCCRWAI